MSITHTFKLGQSAGIGEDIGCIRDDWGIDHPDALVAVRNWSISAQDTGSDSDGIYVIDSKVEAIAYTISFWGSDALQIAGKRSRPIFNADGGGEFQVDLKHPDSIQAQESAMDTREKMFRQIELDVNRRFKAL